MPGFSAGARFPWERLGVYIQPLVQGRGCHVEYSLFYDESDPAETAAADKLFAGAPHKLMDGGAFFSRPYGAWADTGVRPIRRGRRGA